VKIQYRQPSLARAFELASRVAPTAKGGAWDTAAGMLMEIDTDGTTTVRATNLDVAVRIVIEAEDLIEAPDQPVRRRVSSLFLAQFIRSLTAAVTIEDDLKKNSLLFKSGSSRLLAPLMDATDYPDFHEPPTAAPDESLDLGSLADRVLWACDTISSGARSGLHVTSEHVVGVSEEAMAIAPADIPVTEPVTFQARELIGLLRGFNSRITADSEKVFLWLSDDDWVSASLFAESYPNYPMVLERTKWAGAIELQREPILTCLERLAIVGGMDRGNMPSVEITMTKTRMTLRLVVSGVAASDEALAIKDGPSDGYAGRFGLSTLLDAIKASKGDSFTFHYGNPADRHADAIHPAKLEDATGWLSVLMPRRPISA
jgi:DNA polymerase III sliding clamp (beta) subunit (PCNA family)